MSCSEPRQRAQHHPCGGDQARVAGRAAQPHPLCPVLGGWSGLRAWHVLGPGQSSTSASAFSSYVSVLIC